MKRLISLILLLAMALCFASCRNSSTSLSPKDPVTLTIWHVYGEQADSPMNRIIQEFNLSVGLEKGIIIDATSMSNAAQIGNKLLEAQKGNPGAPKMPDLFFCHRDDAYSLGKDKVLNWNELFTEAELDLFVPEFVTDGMIDDVLAVLPVTKSTHLLFLAGSVFERFSIETGASIESLSTWDGFFEVAAKYYEWSGGKPFCAIDYPLRCVELNALSLGAGYLYNEDGSYDKTNTILKESWMMFAQAIAKGHIVTSDLYSNTQVMTGEVISGIGSSASILYYNDTITYPDNTKEPMNLIALPIPQPSNGSRYVTQAGVGLCAYKTSQKKAEASLVFAKWLTDADRNLTFATETGYMPVKKDSFDSIKNYDFDNEAYKSLYNALDKTRQSCTPLPESTVKGYYSRINEFYSIIRKMQSQLSSYESADEFANESYDALISLK